MAVLGNIRKHGVLLIVVIGVALAAFVLGDLSKTQSQGPSNLGEIDGVEITYKEFSARLEQNVESEKQRSGKSSLASNELFYIRQQTWMQFMNEVIMGNEFEELGLEISSEELFELVQGDNPHPLIKQYFSDPTTGKFDPSIVLNFLQNLDQMDQASVQQWLQFENAIKNDRKYVKYNTLVAKGYYIPEAIAEFDYLSKNKVATVKLLAKKYADISNESVTISDSDLKEFYNNNLDLYKLNEEVRGIDYVLFEVQPSVDDRIETTRQVNDLYDEFKTTDDVISFVNAVSDRRYDSTYFKKGDLPIQIEEQLFDAQVGAFVEPYVNNEVFSMAKLIESQNRPDSMRANHILIAYQGAYGAQPTILRTKEKAKEIADSLAVDFRKNSSRFSDVAKEVSDDPTAKDNGGDTGYFPDMGMVWDFNEAVLTGSMGEIKVVETAFGYHIIEVISKKGLSKKIRVAIVSRSIDASSETYQNYWSMASKFAAEADSPEAFELGINDLGIAKRSNPSLSKNTNFIAGISYPRTIVRWAFDNNTELGNISQIFDFDGTYVVALINKIDLEGPQPFEAVRDLVFAEVSKIKKAEYIKSQVSNLTSLDAIAEKIDVKVDAIEMNYNSAVVNLYGLEPAVVGQAFGLEKNKISDVIQGNAAVYVMITSDVRSPELVGSIELSKAQMQSYFASRVRNNVILTALENAAKIEDNRHNFY